MNSSSGKPSSQHPPKKQSLSFNADVSTGTQFFEGIKVQANINPKLLLPLLTIARMGATKDYVDISTITLAGYIGLSQQTASRLVSEAEQRGLLERVRNRASFKIKLTNDGLAYLERMYFLIGQALNPSSAIIEVSGKVFSGLGQGQYYMSRAPYVARFKEILGWVPFPGTLNIRLLNAKDQKAFLALRGAFPLVVEPFEEEGRKFGGVLIYPVNLPGVDHAAVVIPIRTHWGNDTVEIISDVKLRDRLSLEDGSSVTIQYDMSK